LVSDERKQRFEDKMERLAAGYEAVTSKSVTPTQGKAHGLNINQDGSRRTALDLLGFPDIDFQILDGIWPELASLDSETREQISREALYVSYIQRQERDVAALLRDEAQKIPEDMDYSQIGGLSNEIRSKLTTVRPTTLGQAGRIDGMTPAALSLVLVKLRQHQRKSA